MSEEFESSPRATKRRRISRHSGEQTILEDGDKAILDASTSDVAIGSERFSVNSDTIEVRNSLNSRTSSVRKSAARRANARTDHIDATLSSDTEASTPVPNGSQTRGSSGRKETSGQKRNNTGPPSVNKGQVADPSEANTIQATRSSGRARRPPMRLVESLDEQTPTKTSKDKPTTKIMEDTVSRTTSPLPKGILTPSRRRKPKSRKSVAFNNEDKELEEQLGFRDIDTPAPKKLPLKSTPYPNRLLSLSKVREAEFMPVEDNEQSILTPETTDTMIVDDFLDTVPVPEISIAPVSTTVSVDEEPHFLSLKHQVLTRLTSSSLPPNSPAHLDSQFKQLYSLLGSTVASSESNSLLLLGPRGAGKSMLLDLALRDLEDDYPADFHVVRLNGFLQTDDRLALREIWRQLGYSRDLEETETEDIGASYADTMASLLSLLSHADETAVDELDEAISPQVVGQRTTKSIVFILDEFDLFTTHPRQTLLYNLFDIAQSRKAPIVVVGCSSRMDVIECLEKRVKSRFSHRWILVPGCKSLSEWEAEVKNALIIQYREKDSVKLTDRELKYIGQWNTLIESNFLPKEETQHLIRREFYTTKSLPQLYIALYPLVNTLQLMPRNESAVRQEVDKRPNVAVSPSVLVMLNCLPVLHMSLLISMCRLEAIHTLSTVNFNLVYTHYTELIDTSRLKQTAHGSVTHSGSLRKWNRELCREAWEELGIEGLIIPVVGGRDEDGNNRGAEMEEARMWRPEVDLDDISWSVKQKFDMRNQGGGGGAGEVLLKWCKEA